MRCTTLDTLMCVGTTLSVLVFTYFIKGAAAGTCYKDESIGDKDGNVYYCNGNELTRCCTENGERTCCVTENEKNLKEQLQLWGVVAGMIVLIGILFVCCKNDISFCNGDMTLKERCYNCRNRGKNQKAHTVEKEKPNQYYDNPVGDFGGPSTDYFTPREPFKFPPLPPVQNVKSSTMYESSYA